MLSSNHMVTFLRNPSYASELVGLARIVSPSGLMWDHLPMEGTIPIVCDSFQTQGKRFRRRVSFSVVIPHWRLNLIIYCKESICLFYIMNVGRKYHSEKGLMYTASGCRFIAHRFILKP